LPLPFGPAMPKICPGSTSNETSFTAVRAPKDFLSPTADRSGGTLLPAVADAEAAWASAIRVYFFIHGGNWNVPVANCCGDSITRSPFQSW